MNKHQRIRSREIKAIMNADKWGETTYKEAKRKWKKNVRAFPVGLTTEWAVADLSYLKLSPKQMDELGQAVRMLILHAREKHMYLAVTHECYGAYKLRFKSDYSTGRMYGYVNAVSEDLIRLCNCPLTIIAEWIIKDMDKQIAKFGIDTTTPNDHLQIIAPNYRYGCFAEAYII